MSLDTLVNVTIDVQASAISREGFGTPLIAAYHTHWVDRVRTYSASTALTTMADEGFATDSAAYLAMQAILAQSPRPTQVKIGRRASAFTYTLKLTPKETTEGFTYVFEVEGTEISYTVQAGDTVANICAALQTQIDAVTGVTAVDNTTDVDVTATAGAGELVNVVSTLAHGELELSDNTADPGLAADLDAIEAADPDWYGLIVDSQSEAQILAAAAWAETRDKVFLCSNQDTGAKDSGVSDDVLSQLQAAAYANTGALFHENPMQFGGARLMGDWFPDQPGEGTTAYRTLAGLTFSPLSASELAAVKGKNGIAYVRMAGQNVTLYGWSPAGEFLDVTRFVHWLKARIQEDVFGLLVNRKKIPFTAPGIALVTNTVDARLDNGVGVGGLAADPEPTVTAPAPSDVSANDRAARLLPDVNFTGQLAGAIHELDINGTVTA